jgi:hypothetical protein
MPANDACFSEVERQIRIDEAKLAAAGDVSRQGSLDLRRIVLNIALAYLYAGHEREAWDFFDREYRETDRDELKANIERRANADPFYRAVRNRR